LTWPSATPRSRFPSIAIAVSSPVWSAHVRQGAQPAADGLVEDLRADGVEQGPDPVPLGARTFGSAQDLGVRRMYRARAPADA
jgi:hypothetical protein